LAARRPLGAQLAAGIGSPADVSPHERSHRGSPTVGLDNARRKR
jgi:hypothetical protein